MQLRPNIMCTVVTRRLRHAVAILVVAAVVPMAASAESEIADAAMRNDLSEVRALLNANRARVPDVDAAQADGTTALHWAVRWDDIAMAELLIEAGANVARANRYGVTPLGLAAINGSTEAIALLVGAGADPNTRLSEFGETPLMMAARTGNEDAVALLLDQGAEIDAREYSMGQTALMWAAAARYPDVVRLLLERGADANARSDFLGPDGEVTDPGGAGPADRAEWSGGATPLVLASREADSETVGILLDAGADVNLRMANGSTALLVAVLNRHNTLALTLLDAGADPNLADGRGQTPLYAAIDMRNLEVTEVPPPAPDVVGELALIDALLDHGADPNVQVTAKLPYRGGINPTWLNVVGASPFYRAAASGDIAVMRRLLAFGADPGTAAADGTTPLMVVSGIGWRPGLSHTWPEDDQIAALELCLELGADVTDVNDAGLTALHGAAFKGWDHAVRVLVEHGARLDAQDTDGRIPLVWAEGVSFAAQPPQRQESTVSLIVELMRGAGLTDPEPAGTP